jgi:hypothetical protein
MEITIIKPIDITVNSGASVIITIPPQYLKDGKKFILDFVLSEPDKVKFRDLIEGIEIVTIVNGVGGTEYVLEDYKGDIFYADRLFLCYKYKLIWGNNGAISTTAGMLAHFINVNTPCHCARPYNPANDIIPPTDPVVGP